MQNFLPDSFSFKTAWRDARSRLKSLYLYSSGIIAGVAALVAILSFHNDVLLTVNEQAKSLLGADLEVRSSRPLPDEVVHYSDSLADDKATSIEFSSMVLYGESQVPRLSQVRAFNGLFPFYGELKTNPVTVAATYQTDGAALVDQSFMTQLGLSVGDSLVVGDRILPIAGSVLEVPGESAIFSLIGPRVFLPVEFVEGTSLLQRGSQVEYKAFLKFNSGRNVETIVDEFQQLTREHDVQLTTVESRKERFSSIVDNLGRFLGIIAFVALLLGGLGVASAVYVYIKRNSTTVATLRCLGASSRQTTAVFVTQLIAIGTAGAVTGTVAGVLVQQFLPLLFRDFLPFEIVQQFSVSAVTTGLFTGILISFGFSLIPLVSINSIPPLLTLRDVDFSPLAHLKGGTKIVWGGVTTAIVTATLAWLLDDGFVALAFTAGIIFSVVLLLFTANLLTSGIRALRLRSFSYVWRQGVSNLFRPNNQTSILVTTLGMGMLLTGILYLSQDALLDRIQFQTGDQQPDLVFYDIQPDQNEDILEMAEQQGAKLLENVPIITMRLSHRNGVETGEVRSDSALNVSNWALRREYRVTYREHLTDSESLLEGEWIGRASGLDSVVPISIEKQIADDLQLTTGDSLTFDVQGVPVQTTIASIRDVDFQQPQPNFFVLFPAGVLEEAPRFFATVLRTGDSHSSAALQQQVVLRHPNVSAIDVGLVLDSVRQFLNKVAMAVQFMALFSIATGLIVLASAIAISRFQRVQEAVLLRTLGGQRSRITMIQLIEYLLLGLIACITGLFLAYIFGWLIVRLFFDLPFVPDFTTLILASGVIITLVLVVGFFNMRGTLNRKPLEVLRLNRG